MDNLIELLDSEFPQQASHFEIEIKAPTGNLLNFKFRKLTDAAEIRSLFNRATKRAERHVKDLDINKDSKPWKTKDKEIAANCFMMAELYDGDSKLPESALLKFAKQQGPVFMQLATAFEQNVVSLSIESQVEKVEGFLDNSEPTS